MNIMIEWKKVPRSKYKLFENGIMNGATRHPARFGGILTVWDDDFDNEFNPYGYYQVQHLLNAWNYNDCGD